MQPRRRAFVVIDVPANVPVKAAHIPAPHVSCISHMHWLRTVDPEQITDRRLLRQCVYQLQGCVHMLEENAILGA